MKATMRRATSWRFMPAFLSAHQVRATPPAPPAEKSRVAATPAMLIS